MKKWMVIAAALVFAASGLAFASQTRGPGWTHGFRGPERGAMSRRILALLDNPRFRLAVQLTDAQITRLRQIVISAEKSNIEVRAKMQVDGIDLRQLLRADKPDPAAVMNKVGEISQLRGQMMKNNVQALLDARAILSPEQQKQVRQFIGERFSHRGWDRQRMEHHRGRMQMRQGTPPVPPSAPVPAPVPPATPGP